MSHRERNPLLKIGVCRAELLYDAAWRPPPIRSKITDDPVSSPAEGAESPPARRAVAVHGPSGGLNTSNGWRLSTRAAPLLVLAGAGTGKTRVLTTRIAHILITGRARPVAGPGRHLHQQGGARDADRVASLIGGAADGMWLGTFHAIGVRVLRRHAELVRAQEQLQPSSTRRPRRG